MADGSNVNKAPKPHQVGDFSWMDETLGRKSLWKRVQEDPLVPIGCAVTLAVLVGGLWTFHRGHSKLGNKFMQARVIAQTATVMAVSGGGLYAAVNTDDAKKKKNQSYEERVKIELRDEGK